MNRKKQNILKEQEIKEIEKISRKEALVKVGKYAAFTAAATLLILSSKETQAGSTGPSDPPPWPTAGSTQTGTTQTTAPIADPTFEQADPQPAEQQ